MEKISLGEMFIMLEKFENKLAKLKEVITKRAYYTNLKNNVYRNAKLLHTGMVKMYQVFDDKIFLIPKSEDNSEDKQLDTIDMPPLQTEEEAARRIENQGKGLKILTPQQMLTRLPISLAQLQAGNNSQKLKNEIRKLLYSLYRSKKISKTIYEHLINIA